MVGGGSTQTSNSTSYGYLPYITPAAAQVAGTYQADAANAASQLAQQQLDAAMGSVAENYNNSMTALQPYQTQGVQAQDQLNQFLGLQPFNPGSAPTAPTPYTPSTTDISNYIEQNLTPTQAGMDNNIYYQYNGIGAKYNGFSQTQLANGQPTGTDIVGFMGSAPPAGQTAAQNPGLPVGMANTAQKLATGNPELDKQISDYLTTQYNSNNAKLIQAQNQEYQQQLQAYNQNKALYDQYTAQGPLNQQQITNIVTNQPGYQAQLGQGIQAVQNAASSKGLVNSGAALKELTNFGANLESQYYNNLLGNLSNQAAVGANAANSANQAAQNESNALAGLYSQNADAQANSQLAAGQALASAYQLGNTTYNKVITGQSNSSASNDGGLSGIGSLLGGVGSLIGSQGTASSGATGLIGLFGG